MGCDTPGPDDGVLDNFWPDVEAVETMELHERDGVTRFTWRLAFRDQAGRDHMTGFDGQQDSLDEMENILRSLSASRA